MEGPVLEISRARIGLLLKYGMINGELVYDYFGQTAIQTWNKIKDIVRIRRKLYNVPTSAIHWEYLHDEMVKIAVRRGHQTSTVAQSKYTDEMREKLVDKKM